jgi:O-antigen biosynthesis protein
MNEQPQVAVIIVNYNVAFFLEQCLNAVQKAMSLMPAEVWVVDNNSVDGSVAMVREKFPWVKLIDNKDNKGFSSANNQAMRLSSCPYQLLLNPDTVIEEDTLKKVVEYMNAHPKVGGLGVRMVDGKGVFLPESKRGLPTPAVAFYKIFGISRLFPKSKIFGKYSLSYLSEFETNEVEILSGAFMLLRKEALDKVGLLDEAFFMYGEDIDLSYRITQGGYTNVYFPETRIIHYKGESTKKSSVNYVFVFYRAMIIFARKHFSQKNAKLFSFLIHCAIYFRAGLAITSRLIKRITLPVIDILVVLLGLFVLTNYWQHLNIRFPAYVVNLMIPVYVVVWFVSVLLKGGYDSPVQLKKYVSGTLIGTALILMLYGLLPKEWQFSRLFILVGTSWIIVYFLLTRLTLHALIGKKFKINGHIHSKFAVVGSHDEFVRVSEILKQTQAKTELILQVAANNQPVHGAIGTIEQLEQIVTIHGIDEIIFCAKDVTAQAIIAWMTQIQLQTIDFKIAQPDSFFLIGSNSIERAGDLYILNINAISQPTKQRQKRLLDCIVGSFALISFPIICWLFGSKKGLFQNSVALLLGRKTLVSYRNNNNTRNLPQLKTGILSPYEHIQETDMQVITKLELLYAREYQLLSDVRILLRSWKKLDRTK